MSKSSLMDPKIAQRIATTYCEKYTKVGFAAASDYASRILGNNPTHTAQVRDLVVQMLHPISTNKKED